MLKEENLEKIHIIPQDRDGGNLNSSCFKEMYLLEPQSVFQVGQWEKLKQRLSCVLD